MKGAKAMPSFSRVVRVAMGWSAATASVRHVPPVGTSSAVSLRWRWEHRVRQEGRGALERRGHGVLGDIEFGAQYYQDTEPVRDTRVLTGHAVRARCSSRRVRFVP